LNNKIKNILVTGGAGFIGSNFIKFLLMEKNAQDMDIVNLDLLTYSGNLDNLIEIDDYPNYSFVKGDICDSELVSRIISENKIDAIINFAAESHVDRSIIDSTPFLHTNVGGTLCLLDNVRKYGIKRFLQISTDEVYGSLSAKGSFSETSQIKPNSPYSASKAAADHFVMSYYKTFDLPVLITRCSNNYGPNQFPEKLIPLMILNAMEDKKLPVYGKGLNVRDWIFVSDHCRAIWEVFNKGRIGHVYNIGGNSELTNLQVIDSILKILGKDDSLIEFVPDRLGHDLRYAMDISKINKELGWLANVSFSEGIKKTVDWYIDNPQWYEKIFNGEYINYYKENYEDDL
jgi:dTDP-glucose 4,6-dehydratase